MLLTTDSKGKITKISLLQGVVCIQRRFSWRFANGVSCSKTVISLLGIFPCISCFERVAKIRGGWTASVHCCLFWEAFVFCSGAGTIKYVRSFLAVHISCHRSGQTRKQALQYSGESF